MLFNAIDFALFLPITFLLYWFVTNKNLKGQNIFVVVASYYFYACWDWRFLSLIVLSTLVDFSIGKTLQKQEDQAKRKLLLWGSIFFNLGLLAFFKYYNFFLENFLSVFLLFGKELQSSTLNVILPVGISFYTFQTLSYTIDVYRKKINATTDLFAFAAFVSFFPQLVAGPIERASHLLPQFQLRRKFYYAQAVDGLRQILWGLVKKILIADNCAVFVDLIFNDSTAHSGSTLLLGTLFFAFQIYGDFSGYSDIAIGTARLFGFDLKQNFAFPYFSRDIAEFWRRWHISLSTWFRDYLYIPLGGSRGSKIMVVRNVFVIFLVSGFWHGANWTFLVWGALHALFFLPLILANKNRQHLHIVAKDKNLPSIKEVLQMLSTFTMCSLAWVFFRAESVEQALQILASIFSPSLFSLPTIRPTDLIALILVFLIMEWIGRNGKYALAPILQKCNLPLRWSLYLVLILSIIYLGVFEDHQFIYFQF
ncbi:MAG: MBOAT family protein [Saprospiraceae bacterium]